MTPLLTKFVTNDGKDASKCAAKAIAVNCKEDFAGKYGFSERKFTSTETGLIPNLPDWYVIPQEVVTVCQHVKVTSTSHQPMRNFMMRGPAGTGKTELPIRGSE